MKTDMPISPLSIGSAWFMALLPALLLAGCDRRQPADTAGPDVPDAAASAVDTDVPRRGGTLTIAMLDDASRLDPHVVTDAAAMRMIENIYSTLLRYGRRYGDFEADLAESVNLSDDGLTCTIHLVDNARFHTGRPIEAADVVYSLRRIVEMGVRAGHFAAIERYEAPDARTVVLHLREPSAALLSYLAHPMNAIVDRHVIEANDGSLDRADGGSGPFKLIDWQRGRHLILDRFTHYHIADRPYLDRVVYRPMPDETGRTTALRTGEIDLIHEVAPKDVPILEQAPQVHVESAPGTFWEYVGLQCARPPFDDPRVRQAVAWAIDRDMINQLVKFGQATVLDGAHLPPNHWADPGLSAYPHPDTQRARELLAQAGVGPGDANARVELIVDSAVAYQVRAAEMIKQMLAEIGMNVTIQGLESSVFFDRLGRGDFQMTVVGWMGFVDPDEWTWNLFHSSGPYNQQRYANPRVDELLDTARRTIGRDARLPLYHEALRIITADAPMVFLYVNPRTSAWRDRVRGYHGHPTAATIALRDTWLTP